jgi:hypothetical protein
MTYSRVLLTKEEKRVIKKIARVQIASLLAIINKDCEIDITLFVAEEGLDFKEMQDSMRADIQIYQSIYNDPQKIFSLPSSELVCVKHILFNFVNSKKHEVGRKKIWRKFNFMEALPICLQ